MGAAGALFIRFVILLMVGFGGPENRMRLDGRHNRIRPATGFIDSRDGALRRGFLRRIMVKDDRAVLRPDIYALPVRLRGIMGDGQKMIKQGVITDDGRIIINISDFSMAGAPSANLLVGGMIHRAAFIAAFGECNTLQAPEFAFHAPKTPAAKGGAGQICRLLLLQAGC